MEQATPRQIAAARVQHALDYVDRFAGRHHHDDKPARDALVISLLKQRVASSVFHAAELEHLLEAGPVELDALQAVVHLTERVTGGSISLVVDYLVDEKGLNLGQVRARHIEVTAAWAGTQNVQHWLDDFAHTEVRRQIAAQLLAPVAQVVAVDLAQQQAEVAEGGL